MDFSNSQSTRGRSCGWILSVFSLVNVASAVENLKDVSTSPALKSSPDVRFVNFEKASVHCGPAKEHYATSVLRRGASVDVYYETKDGWCGIRPPDGSHDWLAADQAYLLPGGRQAEVVGKKVPAWMGAEASLKDQRFRWQIELQASQKVDVIGELEQSIDSDKVRLWYKILPPPGEFRWILAEALTSKPPKTRSTNVELASATTSSADTMNQPQLAAHQTVIEREPVAGEYIEGEGIVVEGMPNEWNTDEGYVDDQGYIVDGSIEGMPIIEGTIIDEGDQPCPSCQRVGCTTCESSHQTDSFQQWDAVEATGNSKLRFRPIGRILGLIGLSVVEGERVPHPGTYGCPIGCKCGRCIQSHADLNPRSSGRFNHLPRPSRRMPGSVSGDWLGMNEVNQHTTDHRYSLSEPNNRSLLESKSAIGNWHGIAPARLSSSLGRVDTPSPSSTNGQERATKNGSAVHAASAQTEELHFSTPEIQQAMIDLSRAVSESMERWDLREHASRAQGWIEQAVDPIARGEARLLLDRIESFELLRRRSQSAAETAYATSPPAASLVGFQRSLDPAPIPPAANEAFSASPAGVQRNPDGTPASDASGWLVQVHSAEFGQPEYALTDDYGGLIAYVQPAPGMNLSRYLKQPVGIYGAKGYLPSLSARQIIAERIVRIR